ncbi:MAG: DEAD/DEAH box helicase [Polyangiaceae bacterium]|nr:DEAD/DEAH box helicase [Polyangiaceae bacterium]MCB9608211.1 DEAD/DEAH box helicase [Polyangiaceae bacterium]
MISSASAQTHQPSEAHSAEARAPQRALAFVPELFIYTEAMMVEGPTSGRGKRPKDVELPVMKLRFNYGGIQVRPEGDGDLDDLDFDFDLDGEISSGPKSDVVDRDRAAEARAQCMLETFGAVDLSCVEDVIPPFGSEADYLVQSSNNAHSQCSFMAHAVPQLRKLGWRVEIHKDFPYQIVEGHVPWYADVDQPDDDAPGWFSLELGVEVSGERVNLLPALVELLDFCPDSESLDALLKLPARYRAIPVGPNRYLPIQPERLKHLLSVLLDLYRGGNKGEGGVIEFDPGAVGCLTQLEDAMGEAGTQLKWTGAQDVVERARALSRAPSFVSEPVSLKATLRSYQHEGLTWMQHLREHGACGVLADDMGLGKTLQTIAHLTKEKEEHRTDLPSLVLVPTSLIGNWQRETKKFAPHLKICVLHGPKRHERFERASKADVVLTTYPLLVRDIDRLEEMDFHYVILDEAQAIKNPRSQIARTVRRLNSRHRMCLTGTPVENNLEELWSLFDFLMPGLLGEAARFRAAFRIPIEREGNDARLEALRRRVSPFILRRLKESVATELPPKTELVRPVEIHGDQRELYEAIRVAAHDDVRKAIRKKGFAASTVAILDALMQLRQVCCDPRLVHVAGASECQGNAKFEMFFELLTTHLEQGRRVLVFSQFTRMLALISQELGKRNTGHVVLTGGTADRQGLVDRFEAGEVDVFLISLKAGGTGLNLTSADTVIHYDPWWNAAAQAQATDRAYRIGQKRPVFVYNLIVSGSVEERMLHLQRRKRHLADTLLGGGSAAPKAISEEDIDSLLAPLDENEDD